MRSRTEANWGNVTEAELVEKVEPGVWLGNCPWEGCEQGVQGESRGHALELVTDHILEEHA